MRGAVKQYRRGQPSILVIVLIILGILGFVILFIGACIYIRFQRLGGKTKSPDS